MNIDMPFPMIDLRRVSQRPGRRRKPTGPMKTLVIRVPIKLAEKIDRFSAALWRTQTAEIVRRLEESFENQSIDEHGVIVVHSPTPIK
jgi:hypothetical protein